MKIAFTPQQSAYTKRIFHESLWLGPKVQKELREFIAAHPFDAETYPNVAALARELSGKDYGWV